MLSSMNSKRRVMLSKWRNLLRREREGRRSCLIRTLTPIRKMQLMGTLLQVVSSICFFATTETIEHVYYFFVQQWSYIFIDRIEWCLFTLRTKPFFVISRAPKSNKWQKGSIAGRMFIIDLRFCYFRSQIRYRTHGWIRLNSNRTIHTEFENAGYGISQGLIPKFFASLQSFFPSQAGQKRRKGIWHPTFFR